MDDFARFLRISFDLPLKSVPGVSALSSCHVQDFSFELLHTCARCLPWPDQLVMSPVSHTAVRDVFIVPCRFGCFPVLHAWFALLLTHLCVSSKLRMV